MFKAGKTFLKESFSPHPFQRTFNWGILFFTIITALNGRTTYVRTIPSVKVLVKLFQKLAGLGRAHKKRRFFLPSFFFAPLVPKKKRCCGV